MGLARIRGPEWPPLAVVLVLLAAGCGGDPAARPAPPGLGLDEALGGGGAPGFQRVTEPPGLSFPQDHGPHPGFRTEWWYWTGNLADADGRAYGFQLVFFRQALAPPGPARDASLAARELVLAHAALTDVDGGRFHHAERLRRHDGLQAALSGPAGEGAPAGGAALFCGDWSARAEPGGCGLHPVALRAGGDGFAFALRLAALRPPVPQGEDGLSRKGPRPGEASVHYSVTRLSAAGEVEVGGRRRPVEGQAWLDREWGTAPLGADVTGWDWFALQLDDGTELMWYGLRGRDGDPGPFSSGLFVHADGRARRLLAGDVEAVPGRRWTAADGAASYPVAWHLSVPALELELEVAARLDAQELRALVRYWEGAVTAAGRRAGVPVGGLGYLEMTGRAGR